VRFRRLVERGRGPFLVAVAVITAALGWRAARVGVEHDNESLNATNPEQRRVYDEFKATFGNDDDLLVSVTPPALVDGPGLAVLDAVTREIAGLDGVKRVWSLTTAEELVAGDAGAEPRPLVTPRGTRPTSPRARRPHSIGTPI